MLRGALADSPRKGRISVVVVVHRKLRPLRVDEVLHLLTKACIGVAAEFEHPVPVGVPSNALGHIRLVLFSEQFPTAFAKAAVGSTESKIEHVNVEPGNVVG